MDDLYHQQILDHYHHPHNYGKMENPDYTLTETNASCGDACTYYLKIDPHSHTIERITFTGTGCAISLSASSLLTDYLQGQPLTITESLTQSFMQDLIGGEVTLTRLKCLMLPAKALNQIKSNP
jgi:nitrogen fixation NifU-like protein